jgi:hypothetical protein
MQSQHGEQLQAEAKALVHTREFVDFAKFVQEMKKRGPSKEMKKYAADLEARYKKVEIAEKKLEAATHAKSKMVGQDPHQRLIVNVDEDAWYEYNK